MNDFTDNLEATQQSPIPEFYTFDSAGSIERYTNYSQSLTFLGYTFTAASIARGPIRFDTKFGNIKMVITTPLTPNISKYIANQPIEPIEVVVYRSHIDHLDQYQIFFKGKIKYVSFSKKIASAQCVSSQKFLTAKVPPYIYQSFCNHDIYDDGCGVDSNLYRRTATVVSLPNNGKDIQFSFNDGGGAVAVDYFKGGKVNFDNDIRFVTGHSVADTVNLHIPFDSRLEVGSEIEVYPGCDGDPETCINVYNNLNKFLGMPYIPSQNPVIWGFK